MNSSKKIINNVVWQFSERMLAQIVSLIVSIVLARILFPEDYGAVTMITVFITIGNVFVTSGFPTALIQKKDADEIDFSTVFYFNFFLSIIVYFIVFVFAPFVADFYKMEILTALIRVMGLKIVISSISSIQHAYVSRHMIFKKYFWATFAGTVISGGVGIAMAIYGFGPWALVAQYLINSTIDVIVLFFVVEWKPKLLFSIKRLAGLFSFGWKILFEGLANEIDGQLRNLVIGRRYTSSDLGFYSKGQQFPQLVVTNVSTAVGAVLFPAISNEQSDPERVKTILRKSVSIVSYIIFPALAGLALVSKNFILVVLGEKWIESTPYLILFCFINIFTIGMIPRHQALKGTGRSDVFMYEHMLVRIVGLILLFLTYRISVLAIALTGIISAVLMTITVMFTSKKFNGYLYKEQLLDVLPTIILCVLMAVPVFLISFLPLHAFILLILQIVVGISSYVFVSIVSKNKNFAFIVRTIKGKISKKR